MHDLVEELRDYKFPDRKLGISDRAAQKPVDKNNHGINPLEWICMALPADPAKLMYGAYDRYGNNMAEAVNKQIRTPWMFAEEPTNNFNYERSEW